MIKYIFDNDLCNKEYVAAYTNASFIVGKDFSFKDGLFSGYDAKNRKYDKSKWAFKMDKKGCQEMNRILQHSRCVFDLLKKHFGSLQQKVDSK